MTMIRVLVPSTVVLGEELCLGLSTTILSRTVVESGPQPAEAKLFTRVQRSLMAPGGIR
jgi:hypothetical protein